MSRELDAEVAELMGYEAYTEKRGDYTLCVMRKPGDREPWMRVQNPEPERYTKVSCAKAEKIGFFGTGFPAFTTDVAADYEVLKRVRTWSDKDRIGFRTQLSKLWLERRGVSNAGAIGLLICTDLYEPGDYSRAALASTTAGSQP